MTIEQQLSSKVLAERLGVTEGYLAKLRLYGGSPRFAKIGRRVVYDPRDVQAWLDERKVVSTSEAVGV